MVHPATAPDRLRAVNLPGFSQEPALTGADLRALLADPGVPPGVWARGLTMLDDDMAPALSFSQTGVQRLSGISDALLRLSRVGEVVHWRRPVDPTPAEYEDFAAAIRQRGILARPLADLHQTPIGDLMERVVGDIEVLGVGVREFVIEDGGR